MLCASGLQCTPAVPVLLESSTMVQHVHILYLLLCVMRGPLCVLLPAVYLGSYMLAASAGPAFPEDYKHEDGGTYRGEWRGMSKEGLGVYT